MKKYFFLIIFFAAAKLVSAQIYENPIAGKQSHPELGITLIELTDIETIISLQVTNKKEVGGWFCADKNIYIKNSKGVERYQLIKSEGIPTCPDQHNFTSYGEVLRFKLYFPRISSNIEFIDLIENCNNACFYFTGIILNNQHNKNIISFENGFDMYQNKDFTNSIPYFLEVKNNLTNVDSQIYGLSFYYLIMIYSKNSEQEKVDNLLKELNSTNLNDKETILKELRRNNIIK